MHVRRLSPSIHKFDDELIHSGFSAALGHEPFGLVSFDLELMAERLMAERLGPNGVSKAAETISQNTAQYLRIEAPSKQGPPFALGRHRYPLML